MPTVLPDPSLASEIGVLGYLLVLIVMAGVGTFAFFLRRMTMAMDRMADAHAAMPAAVTRLETLLDERLARLEQKMDRAVDLADEHVRIAQLWERTEAVGRAIRGEAGS